MATNKNNDNFDVQALLNNLLDRTFDAQEDVGRYRAMHAEVEGLADDRRRNYEAAMAENAQLKALLEAAKAAPAAPVMPVMVGVAPYSSTVKASDMPEVLRYIRDAAHKIQAIKDVRNLTGLGLKETKELVELLADWKGREGFQPAYPY